MFNVRCTMHTCTNNIGSDNATSVSYINRGGECRYVVLNNISRSIFEWAMGAIFYLTHAIPGPAKDKSNLSSEDFSHEQKGY